MWLCALLAAAAAAALAACGGDAERAPATPTPSPPAAIDRIAYAGDDGNVYTVRGDGSRREQVTRLNSRPRREPGRRGAGAGAFRLLRVADVVARRHADRGVPRRDGGHAGDRRRPARHRPRHGSRDRRVPERPLRRRLRRAGRAPLPLLASGRRAPRLPGLRRARPDALHGGRRQRGRRGAGHLRRAPLLRLVADGRRRPAERPGRPVRRRVERQAGDHRASPDRRGLPRTGPLPRRPAHGLRRPHGERRRRAPRRGSPTARTRRNWRRLRSRSPSSGRRRGRSSPIPTA